MSISFRRIILRFALGTALIALLFPVLSCDSNDNDSNATISGFVLSGDEPIASALVTLFITGGDESPSAIGESVTNADGSFSITYDTHFNSDRVVYLTAVGPENPLEPSPIALAAAIDGKSSIPSSVVINERTTIAAAFALAQFIVPDGIAGPFPGIGNAAAIAGNLADVETGGIAEVLAAPPNGVLTSTLRTFNSLANIIASCVRSESECPALFSLTTTPLGEVPGDTFQAAVNIAHYPWQNAADLLALSVEEPAYAPALAGDADLEAWTLALRYDGNGEEIDGPGNIVFDAAGNAWICNNYVFNPGPFDPDGIVCGGQQVSKFTPTGEDSDGAPYEGGGVYGAGFGIAIDTRGDIWVANFGFQGSNCPYNNQELSQTVSQFAPNGAAISPDSQGNETGQFHGGWQGAGNTIRRPQGIVSDQDNNIWIGNCAGNSLTQFPNGDPDLAFEINPVDDSAQPLLQIPFGVAIGPDGAAWVASNLNGSVFAFDTDGNVVYTLTGDAAATAGIIHPMGIVSDPLGNVWVANSGIVQPPCGSPTPDPSLFEAVEESNDPGFTGENASVTMIRADGTVSPPYKGGGILMPWGITVDGNGNVWVANFSGQRVSQICGANADTCPPGVETGEPISPDGGYASDALVRNTSVTVDPSGNVWLANNWEPIPIQQNPGGREVVVFIGIAKPVKSPTIGPPVQP